MFPVLRTASLIVTAALALTACRPIAADTMSKDAMSKDSMSKDAMAKDTMTKDGAMAGGDHAMPADAMAAGKTTGDAMMKGAMAGDFKTLHAPTTGHVSLSKGADGRWTLTVTNLKTEPAPDLHVWLLPAGDVVDSPALRQSGYRDLGLIETSVASKSFVLPADVSGDAFPNVVLWCDQFSVAFASAALK